MSGFWWFLAGAFVGMVWLGFLTFLVLWGKDNAAAGQQWDKTMADHRSNVRVIRPEDDQ
jgi:hypothetical protein